MHVRLRVTLTVAGLLIVFGLLSFWLFIRDANVARVSEVASTPAESLPSPASTSPTVRELQETLKQAQDRLEVLRHSQSPHAASIKEPSTRNMVRQILAIQDVLRQAQAELTHEAANHRAPTTPVPNTPAPVLPAPASPLPIETVDVVLKRLSTGFVVFNVPSHMRLARSQFLEARLGVNMPREQLVREITAEGEVKIVQLRVSPRM